MADSVETTGAEGAQQRPAKPEVTIRPSRKQRTAMAEQGRSYVAEQSSASVDETQGDNANKGDEKIIQNAIDKPEKDQQAATDGDDQQVDKPKPKTIKDLAAALEVDPKDIYNTMIPVGDGEAISLGELKDAYKKLAPNRERLEAIDRLEVETRVERSTIIRELDNIVKHLPPQALTPEYQNAVKQQMGMISQQETQKLLQIFPEWKEPVRYQAAVDGMLSAAQSYGLTPAEVGNIVDHRWIQALHDLSIYQSKERSAKQLIKDQGHLGKAPVKTNTTASTGSASNSRSARNANGSNRADKIAQVAKLLS